MWHVSVARINSDLTGIVPVERWSGAVLAGARELHRRVLIGRGQNWELEEIGEMAVHRRRRLSDEEMGILFSIKPDAPVFTHGVALRCIAGAVNK